MVDKLERQLTVRRDHKKHKSLLATRIVKKINAKESITVTHPQEGAWELLQEWSYGNEYSFE